MTRQAWASRVFPFALGRTITGKRDDLLGSHRPETLTGLRTEGPGIRSVRGIETFTSLEALILSRLKGVDLRPLESDHKRIGLFALQAARPPQLAKITEAKQQLDELRRTYDAKPLPGALDDSVA
jgi:hypothetical protein